MKHPIIIYTVIFAGYDNLQPVPNDDRFKHRCITDMTGHEGVYQNWQIRRYSSAQLLERTGFSDPSYQNRYFKFNPPSEVVGNSDIHVYLDGSIRVKDYELLYNSCKMLDRAKFSMLIPTSKFANNFCLECLQVLRHDKAIAEDIHRQAREYFQEGFKDEYNTVSAGMQIRKTGDTNATAFLKRWYKEIEEWRTRDQISFPYVLWRTGYKGIKLISRGVRDKLFEKVAHVENSMAL